MTDITKDKKNKSSWKVTKSSKFNKNRSEVFSKLDDKIIITQNNLKTKMCRDFEKNGSCRFGANCHYAHNKDEIRKSPCMFKNVCKKKNCPYDHSDNIVLPTIPKKTKKKTEPFIITFSDSDYDNEEYQKRKREEEELKKFMEIYYASEEFQMFRKRMIEIGEFSKELSIDEEIDSPINQSSKKCNKRDSHNDSPVPFKKNNKTLITDSPIQLKKEIQSESKIEIPVAFKKTDVFEDSMIVKIQTIEIKCNSEQQCDKLINLIKDMKL